MVNGEVVDALARMVHAAEAERLGRALCAKLAGLLERQQYEVVIQVGSAMYTGRYVQVVHVL